MKIPSIDDALCFALYTTYRAVIQTYRPYLKRLGLTYTQFLVMILLWNEERISVKDLGEKLFLDSGTLTPLLKRLEGMGLVKRERCVKDERIVYIEATEEGIELRKKMNKMKHNIVKFLEPNEDNQGLIKAVKKLRHNLIESGKKEKGKSSKISWISALPKKIRTYPREFPNKNNK